MTRASLSILLTMKYYAISAGDYLSEMKGEPHTQKLITGEIQAADICRIFFFLTNAEYYDITVIS